MLGGPIANPIGGSAYARKRSTLKTSLHLEQQKEREKEEESKNAIFKLDETPDSIDQILDEAGLYYNVLDKYNYKVTFYTTSIERPM